MNVRELLQRYNISLDDLVERRREVKTPFTLEGLRKFDGLPAVDAVVAAWTTTGRRPDWDLRVAGMIRDAAPLLARALDRLAAEHGRVPVDRHPS